MLSLRNSIKNKIALPSEFTFDAGMPYSTLKIYEDILDALVCAWVGIEYLNNRCCRFGDDNTTIWIPEQW
ncbi:hypothetical protein SDC9_202834 [bioreactor metagenome]|uniref:DUF429 domain-containing protein n=1 Tax=bioreactor metagenome TaxID=1076179 RepID=A0A645IUQ7_9ZZZZ